MDVPASNREQVEPVAGGQQDLERNNYNQEADAHAHHRKAHDGLVDPAAAVIRSNQRQQHAEQISQNESRGNQRQRYRDRSLQHFDDWFTGGIGQAEIQCQQLLEKFAIADQEWTVIAQLLSNLRNLLSGWVLAEQFKGLIRAEIDHQDKADKGHTEHQRNTADQLANRELQQLHLVSSPRRRRHPCRHLRIS